MKNFQTQIQKAVVEKKIRKIEAEQLFINILSLNIFPFIAAPLIKGFINVNDKEYRSILETRKTEIANFIIQSIKI